ncbi:MAG: MFS transporter, partial [Myxococcota bacterium]
MSQMSLMRSSRFAPLFWTQFLGAFNDNLFKNALVILVTYRAWSVSGLEAKDVVALSAGLFILPFFLFSATAGQLSDKFSKSRLLRWVKALEIGVMGLAVL